MFFYMSLVTLAIVIISLIDTTSSTYSFVRIPPNNNGLSQKIFFQHETVELYCNVSKLFVVPLSNHTDQSLKRGFSMKTTLEELLESRRNLKAQVSWTFNDQAFHRENGELAEYKNLDNIIKYTLMLHNVGSSDSGLYACSVSLHEHIVDDVSEKIIRHDEYISLRQFDIIIREQAVKLSKPIIEYPPTNQTVHAGTNVSFHCKIYEDLWQPTVTRFFRVPNDSERAKQFWIAFNDIQEDSRSNYSLTKYADKLNENQEILNFPSVTQNDSGIYGCVVKNSMGQVARVAHLKLIPEPQRAVERPSNDHLSRHEGQGWSIWFVIGFAGVVFTSSTVPIIMFFLIYKILRSNGKHLIKDGSQKLNSKQAVMTPGQNREIYNLSQGTMDCGIIEGQHGQSRLLADKPLGCGPPSIVTNTDLASMWCPSVTNGEQRQLYNHSSSTTMTSVPLYDHPPSNGALVPINAIGGDTLNRPSVISNPFYGHHSHNAAIDQACKDVNDHIVPAEFMCTSTDNPTQQWGHLILQKRIGAGHFGEVWKCLSYNMLSSCPKVVAAKKLYERGEDLLAEMKIMESLGSHQNVVQMINCCVLKGTIHLIMEYVEGGNLQKYLLNSRTGRGENPDNSVEPLSSQDLIKFSLQIAKGMEYVSSHGIIHRDLAARNILVTSDKVCKIADFGLARQVNDECVYKCRRSGARLPLLWMAPESLSESSYTTESDVFSFGVLMWEIVTLGSTPHQRDVESGEELKKPEHCEQEIYDVMLKCWKLNPKDRAPFKELAERLDLLLTNNGEYIILKNIPDHIYYNILPPESIKYKELSE